MPSNDKKIDNNCITSFKRAKKDVYALMDEQRKQAEVIRELKVTKSHVQVVSNEESIDKNEFREELIKVYETIKSNYDRITEVWEYAESIKASTTRIATSVKKLQKEQLRIAKLAKNSSSDAKRKILSLNKRVTQKTAQLNALKAEQRKMLSQMKKTVKLVSKVSVKKVSTKKPSSNKRSDRNLVNVNEDHEIKYILRKYKKKQTIENIKSLRKIIKKFKATHKNDDRADIYKFLESNKVLAKL